jgi:hypothetical protein
MAGPQIGDERPKSINAEAQLKTVRLDLYTLDQELDDARLLCGEQIVPQRVEAEQCLADLGQVEWRAVPPVERTPFRPGIFASYVD